MNQTPLQKHVEMYLDRKLDFLEHLKSVQARVNKSIALLRKLQTIIPRPTLLTIYKAFIRPTLITVTPYMTKPQRKKCPNTELFLVRIFLYSD